MDNNLTIKKVCPVNLFGLMEIEKILYACGKDMAEKYNLHHWDNSHLKNFIVICLYVLSNELYLVKNRNVCVATFQIKKTNDKIHLQKLATSPIYSGKGIGSFCIDVIERLAKEKDCSSVFFEVYDKSHHAIQFYKNKGYVIKGEKNTLKYNELIMEKKI